MCSPAWVQDQRTMDRRNQVQGICKVDSGKACQLCPALGVVSRLQLSFVILSMALTSVFALQLAAVCSKFAEAAALVPAVQIGLFPTPDPPQGAQLGSVFALQCARRMQNIRVMGKVFELQGLAAHIAAAKQVTWILVEATSMLQAAQAGFLLAQCQLCHQGDPQGQLCACCAASQCHRAGSDIRPSGGLRRRPFTAQCPDMPRSPVAAAQEAPAEAVQRRLASTAAAALLRQQCCFAPPFTCTVCSPWTLGPSGSVLQWWI